MNTNTIDDDMPRLHEIDPYQIHALQECDEVMAHVDSVCLEIEEQLRHPDDSFTFGWLRSAKNALATGKGLRARLHNRRGDLVREMKVQQVDTLNKAFVDHCRATLPPEQFRALWEAAKQGAAA